MIQWGWGGVGICDTVGGGGICDTVGVGRGGFL